MKTEIYELKRQVPIESRYDLVVAGGGPGGCAAAICAGRLGAKVLLVEAMGCLGGMGTSALVSAWSDIGDGRRMIVGGFMAELIEAMHSRGHCKPHLNSGEWRTKLHGGFGYSAEGLKILLDELCLQAGVEIRFFTRVIDADVDMQSKKVNGIVLSNIEGYRYIKSRAFIDSTGDAVLSQLCGAEYREAGRDTAHIMAPTLCATVTHLDGNIFKQNSQQTAIFKAIEDGFFTQPDRHVPGLFMSSATTAIMNAGHLFETNAVKCESLTQAMIKGRIFAREYAGFFQKYVDGCGNLELVATGSLLGVRESRRIVGEYELNYEDFKARRTFPDQIGIYNKSVDIHVHDCSDEQWERYTKEFLTLDRTGPGEHYGIPYGILVPKGWQNLWVAGRCNSSDIKLHGAIRDQPACFMMGEAAGTAAVQSIRTGQPACDLDTAALVEMLRNNGGMLPQTALSSTMTRSV
jgi:hypothetical protein